MNRKHFFFILLIIFIFVSQNLFAQVDFKNINLNDAKKLAQDSNKKILIYLYSIPCPACTLLVKHIFEDTEMGGFINSNYISFKLRGDKKYKKEDYHTFIIEEYGVGRGFPVVMILNSEGKYIDRIRGFGDKEAYSALLKNYTNDIFTMEYYHQQLKSNSQDCEAMVELAKKYQERRLHDKALKYYKAAVKYEPCKKDAWNWYAISVYYKHKKRINSAIIACEVAIELNPDNSQFQSALKLLRQSMEK